MQTLTMNDFGRELTYDELALIAGGWDWGDFGRAASIGAVAGGLGGATTGGVAAALTGGALAPAIGVGGVAGMAGGAVTGAATYALNELF